MTYYEQLKTSQWFDYRSKVIEAKGSKCEHCQNLFYVDKIQVHHCGYDFERKAWEYELDEVKVLCRSCHQSIHRREKDFIRIFDSIDEETLAHLLHGLMLYKEIYEERGRCHANTIYLFLKRQQFAERPEVKYVIKHEFLRQSGRFLNDDRDKDANHLGKGIIESEPPPNISPQLKLKRTCRTFKNFLLGLSEMSLDPLLDGFDVFLTLSPSKQRTAAYNLVRFIQKLEHFYDVGRIGSASCEDYE